eukprot:CAMPEP_0170481914 /NCGR_PEP_ID=MMETSP0208-20121228/2168_1 /TAXON_ID=197538 /ORGANISM="Strombidium inclinatum, Strain S3" /LENGTH=139 /DNA_ID=CAMNT_0010754697 /DNA_START=453 /DNA_END=871 /DNA_ORIENTATION=-
MHPISWFSGGQDVLDLVDCGKASVDNDLEVREFLLYAEHPVILQRRNVSVLLRVESLKEGFASVYDELAHSTLLTNCADEVNEVLPLIHVVDAQAALHCYGDIDGVDDFLANFSDEFWREHELSSEAASNGLVAWAATI